MQRYLLREKLENRKKNIENKQKELFNVEYQALNHWFDKYIRNHHFPLFQQYVTKCQHELREKIKGLNDDVQHLSALHANAQKWLRGNYTLIQRYHTMKEQRTTLQFTIQNLKKDPPLAAEKECLILHKKAKAVEPFEKYLHLSLEICEQWKHKSAFSRWLTRHKRHDMENDIFMMGDTEYQTLLQLLRDRHYIHDERRIEELENMIANYHKTVAYHEEQMHKLSNDLLTFETTQIAWLELLDDNVVQSNVLSVKIEKLKSVIAEKNKDLHQIHKLVVSLLFEKIIFNNEYPDIKEVYDQYKNVLYHHSTLYQEWCHREVAIIDANLAYLDGIDDALIHTIYDNEMIREDIDIDLSHAPTLSYSRLYNQEYPLLLKNDFINLVR